MAGNGTKRSVTHERTQIEFILVHHRHSCESAFLIFQFLKNKHRGKIAQIACNQAWHQHGSGCLLANTAR